MLIILITVLILLSLLIYLGGVYNENYWTKRGVKFYNRSKIFGPYWDFIFSKLSFYEVLESIYYDYRDEPAVGFGALFTPSLYVRDPENIQFVYQTDFHSFNHRGMEANEGDKLADNILFMTGNRWKLMRQNMTPLFTSSKLKNMYYIMDKSAQDFVEYLQKKPEKLKGNGFQNMKTFCCAAITAAVFGINNQSTFESPFLKVAAKVNTTSLAPALKFVIASISETLFKKLKLRFFSEHEEFFIGAVKQVFEQRRKEDNKRHDFGDICVGLQRKGTMVDPETGFELEPTDELLAAQGFFFFIAGIDPCATTMFFALVELGRNPIQLGKLIKEVDEAFEVNDDKITFDVVSGMKYLDNVLVESMRMYPLLAYVTRLCLQDTTLPVGNIKIDKGTKVYLPIYEVQNNARIYPDPNVFNPDRFEKKLPDLYYPFGKGNRACIGSRYAMMQVKCGMVHLLRHFTVNTTVRGRYIRFAKNNMGLVPDNVEFDLIPTGYKERYLYL